MLVSDPQIRYITIFRLTAASLNPGYFVTPRVSHCILSLLLPSNTRIPHYQLESSSSIIHHEDLQHFIPVKGFNFFACNSNRRINSSYVELNNIERGIDTGYTCTTPSGATAAVVVAIAASVRPSRNVVGQVVLCRTEDVVDNSGSHLLGGERSDPIG
jgi:hypothetical protein